MRSACLERDGGVGPDRRRGLGLGPFYNGHLSPYDGRPLGPPLGALPPGSPYYTGAVRRGYLSTRGSAFGPERSYNRQAALQAHESEAHIALRVRRLSSLLRANRLL